MEKVIVIYKINPGMVEENEQLVKEVYKELHTDEPYGFSYATYKLPDGLTFIHIAIQESDGKSPLSNLESFKTFQSNSKERCDGEPLVLHLTEIGSYK